MMETNVIANPEVAAYWRGIAGSLDRFMEVAGGIDPAGLHWRPSAPATNSVAVLAIHTLGNAEENILEILGGEPVHRRRDEEFLDRELSQDDLRQRWTRLRPRLEAALTAITAENLERERSHPRRGTLSGRDVLLLVARHAAEHLGQAELTRDLYLHHVRSATG
jgi:hypothetical protein